MPNILEKYYELRKKYYQGEFRHMRLGQVISNHFHRDVFKERPFPELYYEEDDQKAENIFFEFLRKIGLI